MSCVLGCTACLEAVWANSCFLLPEMESRYEHCNFSTSPKYESRAQLQRGTLALPSSTVFVMLLLTWISVQKKKILWEKEVRKEWRNQMRLNQSIGFPGTHIWLFINNLFPIFQINTYFHMITLFEILILPGLRYLCFFFKVHYYEKVAVP